MKKYIYVEGDYNCDKCGALGDFNGGGLGEDGYSRSFLNGDLVNMDIEFSKGNSKDIFQNYQGAYCDNCVEIIVDNNKGNS